MILDVALDHINPCNISSSSADRLCQAKIMQRFDSLERWENSKSTEKIHTRFQHLSMWGWLL